MKPLLPAGTCPIREKQKQHHQKQGNYPCNEESLFLSDLNKGLKKTYCLLLKKEPVLLT